MAHVMHTLSPCITAGVHDDELRANMQPHAAHAARRCAFRRRFSFPHVALMVNRGRRTWPCHDGGRYIRNSSWKRRGGPPACTAASLSERLTPAG